MNGYGGGYGGGGGRNALAQALLRGSVAGGPVSVQPIVDIQGAQRDYQTADYLQQTPYTPNSGALGAIAQLLGAIASKRITKRADEKFSDAIGRQQEQQREQLMAGLQAQAAEEERKYQRELEMVGAKERERAKYREQKPTKLGPGDVLFGPDGKQIAAVPAAAREAGFDERMWGAYQRMTPEERATFDAYKGRGGDGMTIETMPDGTTRIIQGKGGGLTTPVKTVLQKDMLGAQESLANLDAIGGKFAGDYLTYEGRAKAAVGGFADKLGVGGDLAQFNAKRAEFVSNVRQFFNVYRKEITGAAAGEKELDRLMGAMMNENMGPQEFMSVYNDFTGKVRRNMELKGTQLSGGLPQLMPGQSGATAQTQRPRSSAPVSGAWGSFVRED